MNDGPSASGETTEAPRETTVAKRRRPLVVVAVVVLVAAASLVVRSEMRQSKRDYHAILHHMTEMERLIRAHQPQDIWLHVEGRHTETSPRSDAEERVHEAMVGDLDRLAHLDGFAMRDVDIEVHGDLAVARYRVEGSARPGDSPPPVAGETRFHRTAVGWEMTTQRLIDRR